MEQQAIVAVNNEVHIVDRFSASRPGMNPQWQPCMDCTDVPSSGTLLSCAAVLCGPCQKQR